MFSVSLFASAVRPQLYPAFIKSLEGTTVSIEVVFAGNKSINLKMGEQFYFPGDLHFKYIQTGNIKPAQCYEIARRNCLGETVMWVADDCEFPNDIVGKAYRYWKSKNNKKFILSIQTKESGYGNGELKLFNMRNHCFFGWRNDTPLMAPIGLMSREFLDEIGGLDRRFICGQYENMIVMMAYKCGGTVEIFGDENNYVEIDHLKKAIQIGECTNREDFLNRPFASGYPHDRTILESAWVKDGEVVKQMQGEFHRYEEKDLLIKSQSFKGKWE